MTQVLESVRSQKLNFLYYSKKSFALYLLKEEICLLIVQNLRIINVTNIPQSIIYRHAHNKLFPLLLSLKNYKIPTQH